MSLLAVGSDVRKRSLVCADEVSATAGGPPTRRVRKDALTSELETIRAELEYEKSLRALDAKRTQQMKQRMERQIEFAVEEAKDAKALLEEMREENEHHIEQLRQARKDALEELRDCQMRLDQKNLEFAQSQTGINPKCARLEKLLEARTEEVDGLRQQLEQLQEELRQETERRRENSKENSQAQSLAQGISSQAPPDVLKELNRVRIQLADAERKNRQLRRNVDDLQKKAKQLVHEREAARSASARIKQLEEQLAEVNRNHEASLADMESWKQFAHAIKGIVAKAKSRNSRQSNPNALPEVSVVMKCFDDLKKESDANEQSCATLKKELEQATEEIAKLQGSIRQADVKEKGWDSERKNFESRVQVLGKQLLSLKSQESIWKREVESLRSIVQTYDDLPVGEQQTSAGLGQVRTLELSLSTAREEVRLLKDERDRLQKELVDTLNDKQDLQNTHNTVMEKFAKLREAVYTERAKAEKAEDRASKAETLAGKGGFNSDETRVLHLQQNPLREALQQEINVLRRQVEALSGSKQKPIVSEVDPNKLHQRLKESFKEQISRFREGVYLMTGFRIDMIPGTDTTSFRVRSVFAEREQDHLMLRWPEGQEEVTSLDILNTELAQVLTTTPSYEYMTKFHSLPAFLASVQLSLFEKQTMV